MKNVVTLQWNSRSEEENLKCGGAKGSNHLTGCAVDIKCYGSEQMIRMAGIIV